MIAFQFRRLERQIPRPKTPDRAAVVQAIHPSSFGAVREFDQFDAGNGPHRDHDFGAIDLHGQKWFWKFDYQAPDMHRGSDDPADIGKTHRVLTIMHASEY
jgi:hypothetical protein